MEASLYHSKEPHKVLAQHECKKKHKYLALCTAQ
jgi:hypothetical protein